MVQRTPSPNGIRVAWLYRLNCGGAMNGYEGAVFLSERSQTINPLEFEEVQSVLYPYHEDATIVWQDAQHLIVRCPTCEAQHFKKRNATWKDVSLRYEKWENQTISFAGAGSSGPGR
jgi:hypothetical protein